MTQNTSPSERLGDKLGADSDTPTFSEVLAAIRAKMTPEQKRDLSMEPTPFDDPNARAVMHMLGDPKQLNAAYLSDPTQGYVIPNQKHYEWEKPKKTAADPVETAEIVEEARTHYATVTSETSDVERETSCRRLVHSIQVLHQVNGVDDMSILSPGTGASSEDVKQTIVQLCNLPAFPRLARAMA